MQAGVIPEELLRLHLLPRSVVGTSHILLEAPTLKVWFLFGLCLAHFNQRQPYFCKSWGQPTLCPLALSLSRTCCTFHCPRTETTPKLIKRCGGLLSVVHKGPQKWLTDHQCALVCWGGVPLVGPHGVGCSMTMPNTLTHMSMCRGLSHWHPLPPPTQRLPPSTRLAEEMARI